MGKEFKVWGDSLLRVSWWKIERVKKENKKKVQEDFWSLYNEVGCG